MPDEISPKYECLICFFNRRQGSFNPSHPRLLLVRAKVLSPFSCAAFLASISSQLARVQSRPQCGVMAQSFGLLSRQLFQDVSTPKWLDATRHRNDFTFVTPTGKRGGGRGQRQRKLSPEGSFSEELVQFLWSKKSSPLSLEMLCVLWFALKTYLVTLWITTRPESTGMWSFVYAKEWFESLSTCISVEHLCALKLCFLGTHSGWSTKWNKGSHGMLHWTHQNLDFEDCDLDLSPPLSLASIHFILQRKVFMSYAVKLENNTSCVFKIFYNGSSFNGVLHHDTIWDESVSKVFIVNLRNKVSKHLTP